MTTTTTTGGTTLNARTVEDLTTLSRRLRRLAVVNVDAEHAADAIDARLAAAGHPGTNSPQPLP